MAVRRSRSFLALVLLLVLGAPAAAQVRDSVPARDSTAGAGAGAGALIRGTVYDSVTHTFLPGAVVQVLGDSGARRVFMATTDVRGEFEIRGVPAGRYLAGFFHDAFDVLGVTPAAKRLVLSPSDTLMLRLSTPGARAVMNALCRAAPTEDSSGVVLGYVRDAESGAPLTGGTVVVSWPEIVLRRNGVRSERRQVTAKTDGEGWFGMCGVPSDADVALRAEMASDSSGFVPVEVKPRGIVRQDLRIGRGNAAAVIAADSARADRGESAPLVTVRRGTARLVGTVARKDGSPLPNAQLLLWGSDATATSKEDGSFALGELPSGTYTLEVRYVGFLPRRIPVELSRDRTTNVLVVVTDPIPVLDAVVVYGKRTRPSRVSEVMERRKRGAGHFLTREDIQRLPVHETTDLLRRIPGVRVIPNGQTGYAVLMRRDCVPVLWVDGVRYDTLEDQQLALPEPEDIAVMEVYNGAAQVPVQYSGTNICAAVVIWTGQ